LDDFVVYESGKLKRGYNSKHPSYSGVLNSSLIPASPLSTFLNDGNNYEILFKDKISYFREIYNKTLSLEDSVKLIKNLKSFEFSTTLGFKFTSF